MPPPSAAGLLLKIRIADSYEQFAKQAADPESTYVAPILIASVLTDLERMIALAGLTV